MRHALVLCLLTACSPASDPPAPDDTPADTTPADTDASDTTDPTPPADTDASPADTAPDPAPLPTTAEVQAALQVQVQGLLYLSESESPVDVVVFPGAAQLALTPDTFPDLVAPTWQDDGFGPLVGRPVELRTLDSLFARLTTPEPWWDDFLLAQQPRWQAIADALAPLSPQGVFRIGTGTAGAAVDGHVHVWALGGTADGDLVGIHVVSVET
jgi:hypothetical protein